MTDKALQIIGWREWVTLPDLASDHPAIPPIKAKIDTGARTSALHACFVEPFERDGQTWVRFGLHPHQGKQVPEVICQAPVKDQRTVTDSGGHKEQRYVIDAMLALGASRFQAEITLTDRENMRFRMLLGRTAVRGLYLVDSQRSFLLGGTKTQPPSVSGML